MQCNLNGPDLNTDLNYKLTTKFVINFIYSVNCRPHRSVSQFDWSKSSFEIFINFFLFCSFRLRSFGNIDYECLFRVDFFYLKENKFFFCFREQRVQLKLLKFLFFLWLDGTFVVLYNIILRAVIYIVSQFYRFSKEIELQPVSKDYYSVYFFKVFFKQTKVYFIFRKSYR